MSLMIKGFACAQPKTSLAWWHLIKKADTGQPVTTGSVGLGILYSVSVRILTP